MQLIVGFMIFFFSITLVLCIVLITWDKFIAMKKDSKEVEKTRTEHHEKMRTVESQVFNLVSNRASKQ